MMQTLLGFIKKEFLQTLTDPRMAVLLFVAPMLQIAMFGLALTTETRHIKLAAAIHEDDAVMRDIYQHAMASSWFVPAKTDSADPYGAIRSGAADAVLVPPPGGLTRALERSTGEVQILLDASNVVRGQSIERYLMAIAQTHLLPDSPPQKSALDFDLRILYNPALRSDVFMVPSVMGLALCITTILLTSMAIAREKEMGTFETIISAPVTRTEVILGKTIPYVILGIIDVPLIVAVAVLLFNVPLTGGIATLALAAFVYICATVSIGIFISTIANTQQQAMMGGFIFLFPAIMLSGMMCPVENMPWYLRIVAYSNPVTYFMDLMRNIMLKGGDPSLVRHHLAVLAAMALGLGILSINRFKTRLS